MTPLFRARTAAWHSTSGLSGVMAATAPCSGHASLDKMDQASPDIGQQPFRPVTTLHPLYHALHLRCRHNLLAAEVHRSI